MKLYFKNLLMLVFMLINLSGCLESEVQTSKVGPGANAVGGNSNSFSAPVFSYGVNTSEYILNLPYLLTPAISFGGVDLNFNIIGTLPSGLSLNANTGVISGTPTSGPQSNIYMILATNGSGSSFQTLQLKTGAVFEYSAAQFDYVVGTPFSQSPTVSYPTQGAVSFSISPALPPGLSLDSMTGIISGTPSAASVVTAFTITGSYDGLQNSITVNLNEAGPPIVAYAASYEYIRSNSFSMSPVLTYLGPSFSASVINGTLPSGISINASTGALSGTPLGDVDQSVTIQVSNSYGSASHIVNFSEVGPPIFSNQNLAGTFFRGTAFNFDTNSGLEFPASSSVSYTISPELPSAVCSLSFNTSTGVISGTISTSETLTASECARTYTITATNSADPLLRTTTLSLDLSESGPPQFIYSAGTKNYTYGEAFISLSPTVYYAGTLNTPAYTTNGGTLPPGLSLNSSTGVISGTPTGSDNPEGSVHQVQIRLTNSYGHTDYTIDFEEIGAPRVTYPMINLTYLRRNPDQSIATPTISFCKGGCDFSSNNINALFEIIPTTGEIRAVNLMTTKASFNFILAYQDQSIPANIVETEFSIGEGCNPNASFPGQDFGGGGGVNADPWLVCQDNHIRHISTNSLFLADHYFQTEDIDLGNMHKPIGLDSSNTSVGCFSGGYNGNKKYLINIHLYDTYNSPPIRLPVHSGLFQCLDDFHYIIDLTLLNVFSSGTGANGSLAGSVNLTAGGTTDNKISNVQAYNSYLVDDVGAGFVGGLVGRVFCSSTSNKLQLYNNIFHGSIHVTPTSANTTIAGLYNSDESTFDCIVSEHNAAFFKDISRPTPGFSIPGSFYHPDLGLNSVLNRDVNDSVNISYSLNPHPNMTDNILADLDINVAPSPIRFGNISFGSLDPQLTSDFTWESRSFSILNGDYQQTFPPSWIGPIVPKHLCDRESNSAIFDPISDLPFKRGGAGLVCQ